MRETIGKLSSEAWSKDSSSISPIEIQQASEKEYLEELKWAVLHARGKVDCNKKAFHEGCDKDGTIAGDFFIEAVIKKEKLMPNVLRNYFKPRNTCPTPTYDQTLYRFNSANEEIEFIWCVPDRDTCQYLRFHALQVQEKDLLKQVLDFYDGTLMEICKKFNKETKNPGGALEL